MHKHVYTHIYPMFGAGKTKLERKNIGAINRFLKSVPPLHKVNVQSDRV